MLGNDTRVTRVRITADSEILDYVIRCQGSLKHLEGLFEQTPVTTVKL